VAQEINGSTTTSSAASSSSTKASAASAVNLNSAIAAGVVAGLEALVMSWLL
jgi:hypothetical protein